MAKYIVIALLTSLLQVGLTGCSTESEDYSSKDIIEAILLSTQWQIQLEDEATGHTKTPAGYCILFDSQQRVKLINGNSYVGSWELRWTNDIVYYDDYSAVPTDNEDQLVWDEVEDRLFLVLHFSTKKADILSQHWRVERYNSRRITLSSDKYRLIFARYNE